MSALPTPPRARRLPVERVHHGDVFLDDYEWLRDPEDPHVLAYLEAENSYAEAMTADLEPLRKAIYREIKARTKESDLSVPIGLGSWWYYSRTVEGEQYPLHARVPRTPGSVRPEPGEGALPGEQLLLDENAAAAGSEFFALGAFTISPDHSRLAYAVDLAGDERFDLRVIDLATGAVLDDSLTGIGYGVEFSADADFVFYTRVDQAWRPHQLWRHQIGRPASEDVLLYEEADERFWMGLGVSRDQRSLVLALGSKTTSETWLLPADDPLGAFAVVAPRREGVDYDVEPFGDRLYIVHNRDNPEFDLAWASLREPARWHPLAQAGPGERLVGVDAFADFAILSLRSAGTTALRVLPADAGAASGYGAPTALDFPGQTHTVALADNPEPEAKAVVLTFESMTTPRTVLEVDPLSGERRVLRRQPVLGGYDERHYAESRLWATAADGTAVPVTIVHRADVAADGRAPGLLYAYGAYETSLDPWFSVARLSLLDRGVVFAVAHVRGGGEMGRTWYDQGKLAAKATTFRDVIAVQEHLVATGWVNPEAVALEGGSAGGLTVGAVLNQAPERFRVALAAVPFVDPLTSMLRPDLPLTVGEWEEWGNPLDSPADYAVMRSYAPYDNVRHAAYPAILATTSLHDTRVLFTEPAKWVARLRQLATNDPATRPILLRTEMAAGHGGRSGRYAAWEQIAWEWAFVLAHLGATALLPTPTRPFRKDDHS